VPTLDGTVASPSQQTAVADEVDRRRRETLGGSYLVRAVDELRSSGSSDALYRGYWTDRVLADPMRRGAIIGAATAEARIWRVEFARTAILFCLLAAEAFANQYLQWHLTGAEFEAADRLPTFDKYVLGPRLVHGGDLLARAAEPARTLKQLLKLRSRLVHPKLQPERPASGATVDPPDFKDFNPSGAARYLVAVALAAGSLLTDSPPGSRVDVVVAVIDQERQFFLDFGKRATDELPPFGSEPAPDLFREAIDKRHGRIQAEPPVAGA
jgi:hypothetical protein